MNPYTALPSDIASAATNAHNTAADILSELTQLENYVSDLGASWLGVASGIFQAMMTDWMTYARMLYHALDDIGSGLQGNFVNYVNMEQENISQLIPISGEIPIPNLSTVPGITPAAFPMGGPDLA